MPCKDPVARAAYQKARYQSRRAEFVEAARAYRLAHHVERPTLRERFWAGVQKSDGCWTWTRSRFPQGYGQIKTPKGGRGAHRVSWMLHFGDIPDGLYVCHHCDNPRCVRPDHLFLGTARDNSLDMHAKGRAKFSTGDDHYLRKHPEKALRGETNPQARLTADKVRFIRNAWKNRSASARQLADETGITPAHVHQIVNRRRWAALCD